MLWKFPVPTTINVRGGSRKNDSATLRGGRHRSRTRQSLHQASIRRVHWAHRKCSMPSALPYRGTRRASGPVPPLRPSRHLLQLAAAIAIAPSVRPCSRQWIAARQRNCCRSPYCPRRLHTAARTLRLALQNKKVLYDLCSAPVPQTLLEVARDPETSRRRDRLPSVLHTWGQNLLAPSAPPLCHSRRWSLARPHPWIHPRYPFFLPVKVLSRVFRGKFVAGLKRRFQPTPTQLRRLFNPHNEKAFRSFLRPCSVRTGSSTPSHPSAVPSHVLRYLARYTHRVAITNHRLAGLRA